MQVVLVPRHGHHLRDDGLLGPLRPELLHKFLRKISNFIEEITFLGLQFTFRLLVAASLMAKT